MLLMLRHQRDCGWKRGSQLCLVGNVRASQAAWAALDGLARGAPTSEQHGRLIGEAQRAAQQLRFYYNNPVFQNISASFAP